MHLYVTDSEIKSFLGISASTYDTVIAMYNKMATDILNGLLSVSDLSLHLVEDEKHDGGTKSLELRDMNVQAIGTIMDDELTYTQTDPYDIDGYVLNLDQWLSGGKRKVLVDYVAGWNAGGYATIEVSDYSLVSAGMTLTIAPGGSGAVTLTEGTDWDAATSNSATASSIVDAINSGVDGIRAFALSSTVYIVDETAQRESSTLAASVATGLSLSGSTLSGVNFPEALRFCVFQLCAGMFARYKKQKVKSYTIGSKTVSFANDEDAAEFKQSIKQYQRARLFVI